MAEGDGLAAGLGIGLAGGFGLRPHGPTRLHGEIAIAKTPNLPFSPANPLGWQRLALVAREIPFVAEQEQEPSAFVRFRPIDNSSRLC